MGDASQPQHCKEPSITSPSRGQGAGDSCPEPEGRGGKVAVVVLDIPVRRGSVRASVGLPGSHSHAQAAAGEDSGALSGRREEPGLPPARQFGGGGAGMGSWGSRWGVGAGGEEPGTGYLGGVVTERDSAGLGGEADRCMGDDQEPGGEGARQDGNGGLPLDAALAAIRPALPGLAKQKVNFQLT